MQERGRLGAAKAAPAVKKCSMKATMQLRRMKAVFRPAVHTG